MSNKFFLNIFFILQIGIGFPVVIYIYTFVIPYPLPDKNSKELFIVDRFKKYELLQDNYSNLGKINKNTIIYQKTDTTFFYLRGYGQKV